ncbi:class I SAM-dependent methyltransferase [Cohnella hongkongensis]|uniref:Class I SAM-dependent methyltransferase n=1 Tax=Cohnella hongkongensis TaxID=178337 RepID=A0ABV9F6C7_9BACL
MERTPETYFDGLYESDADLDRVGKRLREAGMRDISVAAGYGRLLTLLVTVSGAKRALEIGALGGYSGICLARGLGADGKLVSLEIHREYAELALANMRDAGLGDRVEYRVGDASASLDRLKEEGEKFDFFFIDADKENYPLYLEACIELANDGAIIAADNTLLRGKTIDDARQGPSVRAIRQFNLAIARDARLQGVHLPAFDGLALARVKG